MEAFEISEVLSSGKDEIKVNGRALIKLRQHDELFFCSAGKVKARLLKIIFWGSEIDEIEAPHHCTLILTPDSSLVLKPGFLYQ